MKRSIFVVSIAAFALATASGCDRPRSAANEPGATARNTPTNPAQTADTASPATPATSATTAPPPSAASAVGDTIITGKVKAAIAADPGMKDSDISVATDGGIVRLTGAVKSPEQLTLAAALAQRQEGVSRVENNVAVK